MLRLMSPVAVLLTLIVVAAVNKTLAADRGLPRLSKTKVVAGLMVTAENATPR